MQRQTSAITFMRQPLPIEFIETLKREIGESEAERLCAALDGEALTSIRLNPYKDVPTYEGEPVAWCEWGRYLAQRPQFTLDPLLHGGAYYVQEASSQFVAHILRDEALSGRRILDMCAAPGGKSTIYSTLVGREGLVVANDISRSRALALSDNVQRWGLGNVVVTCGEPRYIGAFESWFDVVAVDAPCSGEGMFRKMDEARSEWSPSSPQMCADRQREIVAEAWRALRPGGTLIYSTCTFNHIEDEGVAEWLMAEYGDEIEPFTDIATPEQWGIVRSMVGAFQCFHFYPHRAAGEGFFAAVARKRGGATKRATPKPRKKPFTEITKSDYGVVTKWVDDASMHAFKCVGDTIYAYNRSVVDDVVALASSLNVIYSGVAIGQIFKGKLKPEHPLALYVGRAQGVVPEVEVDIDNALCYLRRQDVVATPFTEGINIVKYKGVAIGFIKRIGARCNNMYPMEQRIIKN